jgi:sulfur carrier protein ThiS
MRVYLGGYLSFFSAGQAWVEVRLKEPARLSDVLGRLGIPAGEIYLTVVNGQMAEPDKVLVADRDQVKLYPPVDGG